MVATNPALTLERIKLFQHLLAAGSFADYAALSPEDKVAFEAFKAAVGAP
jgi:hypothetical protein